MTETSHAFRLYYDVTEFTNKIRREPTLSHEIERQLMTLKNKLQLCETYDSDMLCNTIENFAKSLCIKLKEKRPIYKKIDYMNLNDVNIQTGRPLKYHFGFEIGLNAKQINVDYLGCRNIDNKDTSTGDGTHLFDIFTTDMHWATKELDKLCDTKDQSSVLSDPKEEGYTKLSSDKVLKIFQEDVLQFGEIVGSEMEQEFKLIGLRKHKQGVCVAMLYKSEGILIDLFPVVCLPTLCSQGKPMEARYNDFEPNYQAKRYMELNGFNGSGSDLYLIGETDRVPGSWHLTSIYRDHWVIKRLQTEHTKARVALGITKYLLNMYILENTAEVDPYDSNFEPVQQVKQNKNVFVIKYWYECW